MLPRQVLFLWAPTACEGKPELYHTARIEGSIQFSTNLHQTGWCVAHFLENYEITQKLFSLETKHAFHS